MKTISVNYNNKPAYDIVLDDGELFSFSGLDAFKGRRALAVTDENVAPLYLKKLTDAFSNVFSELYSMELPSGENNKTLSYIEIIYETLCRKRFDRNDLIIALGGGVIGDMAGFAAATYLRGIRFIQIPTTLLSQTDSSIGGKTGVDFKGYKNYVGAFHMPSLVYINPKVLATLPKRQFSSGMAEIIKHSLIKSSSYTDFLEKKRDLILSGDTGAINEMIALSCEIKAKVVENDPTEKGERALLNFGHTIGHAVEKYFDFKLLHGECVALGSVAASYISFCRGYLTKEDLARIEALFRAYGLEVHLNESLDGAAIVSLMKSDKKMNAGKIRFVLLKRVGEAFLDESVSDEELTKAIKYISG